MSTVLLNNLKVAYNEKDVENTYRQFLINKISDMVFTSPYGCDGFGESSKTKVRVLVEFKDDLDLKNKTNQIKVLAQAVYYIKKFELSGNILPTTVFVGDRNECFVIHVNDLFPYLSMDLDWNIAPSNAHKNLDLVTKMMEDEKLNPHIFSIENFNDCVDKLLSLTEGVIRLIPITPHNITEVFGYFENNVLGKHNLTTNQLANLFVQLLINPDENYLHPVAKRKTIVTKSFNEVNVKSKEAYTSFFSHFASTYTPKQKEQLTAVVDRLVQDVTRRKQGEFFTPTIWVDKAHEYIASVFGDDWKEKYVVWDPAWGTGNLTRDYKFKELYVSTLNYSDIQTAEQMGYNLEAVKFQFDFLNDVYELLPQGLRNAIESGKEIIVLMNPPYATAGNNKTDGNHKGGVAKTKTNLLMIEEGWGKSAQNLYAQFFYRIYKLQEINKNIKIAVFCKPLYLTGDAYQDFRKKFFESFGFQKGFLFEAANFSDVAKGWGINFAIFSEKTNNTKNSFTHNLIKIGENIDLITYDKKLLYNTDEKKQASKWVREEIKGLKTYDAPQISSATKVKQDGIGTRVENSFGYLQNEGNNVSCNEQRVSIVSSTFSHGHGLSVISQNFNKCISLFTSRKLISNDWINDKDEYLAPNEEHSNYQQYTYDSLVYSLFNNSSQQSSLRQITYKDKLWDIKNEFFWLSKQKMMDLADTNHYTELYSDARTSEDRYVHTLLFGEQDIYNKLSPDAKLVLDKATELVEKSMRQRQLMADDTNHLNSWDAGYAQLKLVWKEYFPDEFKEFRQLYKNLEDRMRPLVYELGFLLK